ncbi:MAG TPA: hypothetical protein VIC56_06230 [Gemmatimonadota bacterium]
MTRRARSAAVPAKDRGAPAILAAAPILAALPVLVSVVLVAGCRGGDDADEGDGFLPGDSLAARPESVQMIDLTGGSPCPAADENPERLGVRAAWQGDHVRVSGTVEGGAGNALSLGLSQGGSFVYDEVFRSELLSVINLGSDTLDAVSVTYEPSRSEAAAFARTGAVALDRSQPVCADVTLYERGSLDRLASRSLRVEGTPAGAGE